MTSDIRLDDWSASTQVEGLRERCSLHYQKESGMGDMEKSAAIRAIRTRAQLMEEANRKHRYYYKAFNRLQDCFPLPGPFLDAQQLFYRQQF